MRGAVRALVALAIALALFFVPWRDVGAALAGANPIWVIVAFAASGAIFPFWVWQWRLLAQPLGRVTARSMFEVVAFTAAAKVSISGVGGIATAVTLLHLRAGLPLSATAGMMAVDQFVVGIAKLVVLALALAVAPLPAPVLTGTLGFAALMVLFLLLMLLLATGPHRLPRHLLPRHRLVDTAIDWMAAVAEGLAHLGSPVKMTGVTLLAIVKKSTEIAAALAVQLACGIEPSLAAAILTVAAVSLVTVVPVMPANLGTQVAGVYVVYEALGVPTALALTAGVLQHVTLLLAYLAAGAIALVARSRARALAGSASGHHLE